ncbi:hypothetical protein BJ875DRAFT_489737 [Amylocarpus encephaloides]|uniref:Uncharacterized protein n=1 Tax=Amylocarpus encephaloides TaxID=45428 RepID=A0A9P8C073_9HELO|nr:hypothetical protein BJ875DRAFT_489737 [Amylocarpus encephaloides]
MGVFSNKPIQPDVVPTDTIIPLHSIDNRNIYRAVINDLTQCFSEVLDPEILRSSLDTLFGHGNWRKLGARLRIDNAGDLYYHIPERYSTERPAFAYSHEIRPIAIEQDPLASTFPKGTLTPSISPDPLTWGSLARTADTPTKVEDWLYSDKPQLSLHIVSFTNATLVSMTWLHTLLDGLGRYELFKAWTLVMQGRVDEVPDMVGFDVDPLATFGGRAEEECLLKKHQITGFQLVPVVIRCLLERILYPKEATKTICIPASFRAGLKEKAVAEARMENSTAFLSDHDIMVAWWARLALQHLAGKKDRTVALIHIFGNSYPRPIFHGLEETTLARRNDIQKIKDPTRNSQTTRSLCQVIQGKFYTSSFGGGDVVMLVFSNTAKAKFYEADFSAAVVGKRENAVGDKTFGRPKHIHVTGIAADGFSTRNIVRIYGKDHDGNCWLTTTMREENWKSVQEVFDKLAGC